MPAGLIWHGGLQHKGTIWIKWIWEAGAGEEVDERLSSVLMQMNMMSIFEQNHHSIAHSVRIDLPRVNAMSLASGRQ